MEKIKINSIKESNNPPSSSISAVLGTDSPEMLTMYFNGKDLYSFTADIDRVEEMIEWLYENTTGRFTFLGTENIYFENSEDGMAFKLRWQ